MSTQPSPIAERAGEVPKLLLDTQIFRYLAAGKLGHYKDRLLEIAKWRAPPLFWACEITFEELLGHVRPEKASEFEHFRAALEWMDRLCGNLGMSEILPWVLRRGVFATSQPHNDNYSAFFNRLRRRVISTRAFDQLAPDVLEEIARARANYLDRVDGWVRTLPTTLRQVEIRIRRSRDRGDPIDVVDLATQSVLIATRMRAMDEVPLWGPLRSRDDQMAVQRERIAFEASQIFKALNPSGYNITKHKTDYNDSWLCAYPAAGYTLVTHDDRLKAALRMGRCQNPRVVNLNDALRIAETWLGRDQ